MILSTLVVSRVYSRLERRVAMFISTNIGRDHELEGVVGNSPGPRKELADWHEVGKSAAGAITVGSFTSEMRPGNSGEVFWVNGIPTAALNSLGLPNKPPEQYSDEIEELRQYGKPIIVSLAGFKPEEYVKLAKMFADRGFIIELNLTCPNVEGKGIFAFDLQASRKTIIQVRQTIGNDTLVVKLNPHPDAGYIERMCVICDEEKVDTIALGNTVPNCLILDPNTLKSVITPNKGLGGLSGTGIKPIMMGQVFQYRHRLPTIGIIAEGGIWSGRDILDYFVAGANFCRTATLYAQRGAKVFTDLTAEFLAEMESHKFEGIADIPVLSAA